jgi:hypothetical protein
MFHWIDNYEGLILPFSCDFVYFHQTTITVIGSPLFLSFIFIVHLAVGLAVVPIVSPRQEIHAIHKFVYESNDQTEISQASKLCRYQRK